MSLRKLFAVLPALVIALLLGAPMLSQGAKAEPVKTGHIEVELVAQEAGVAPGSTVFVALRQKIQPGWHTYWRNPGDAGDATRIVWTLPAGWTAGDIVWPTPEKSRVGPLLDFAYTGEVLLPVPISVPADAQVGSVVTLKAAAAFLVCEQVCVPEDAVVTLTLPVVAGVPATDPEVGRQDRRDPGQGPQAGGAEGCVRTARRGAEAGRDRRAAEGRRPVRARSSIPIPARSSSIRPSRRSSAAPRG
jgi:DsbC/DsbD-like thiol-disulfide interchange protein